MTNIGSTLQFILWLYTMVLIARVVLDYIRLFARSWQPRGVMLLLAESIYSLTDPPLRFVRRFIPPLRLGSAYLDLSFLVVFFAVSMVMRLIPRFF